jgi:thioredoxin-like negative regulator of GroEL
VERLAGDLEAAELALRDGYEGITALEEQGYQSTVAALLAHVLIALGRVEEADRLVQESASVAADDDVTTRILVQAARGGLASAHGEIDDAVARCREAVTLAEATDDVNMRGDVLLDLARALAGAGDEEGARMARQAARELFASKGNVVQAAAVTEG